MPRATQAGPPAAPKWEPEGGYDGLELLGEPPTGLDLGAVDAPGARFTDCRLSRCTLMGGDLELTGWRGVRLDAVRLVGVRLARSQWHRVELAGCALSGCEAFGATMRRVELRDCTLDSVNLRGAVLDGVRFVDCVLRDVDLGSAQVSDVSFAGSRIERLDLTGAHLQRVDLRRARLDVARGFDRLAGAVIEPDQLIELAPAFAAHLGLRVLERDEPV